MIQNTPSTWGPWAVVTGASSGIGAEFARALAARGIHVVLVARREALLRELALDLADRHGTDHRVVVADLATPEGASRVLAETADLDVGLLVSNAGAGQPGAFLPADPGDLHRRLRLNVGAHLDLVHGFATRFVARGGGAVEIVSALGAVDGIAHMAHDAASKAYVASLGAGLHRELAPHGITVSVLLPGNVDTPIIDQFGLTADDLPMSPYPVDRAVAGALKALERGRPSHVPDPRMRWITRLVPAAIRLRVNGRMLGRAARRLAEAAPEQSRGAPAGV